MSVDPAARRGAPAGAGTVPPFDQVAVAVAPGDDLVVRLPGMVVVVAAMTAPPGHPGPSLGGWTAAAPSTVPPAPAGEDLLDGLLALCRRVSGTGSRAPGRRLHAALHAWLPEHSDLPSFAIAAATEEGLAIALVGTGVADVPELGLRLSATDGERMTNGAPFLDRLVEWPPAALRLSAGPHTNSAPHRLADLQAGAVPGAAAVLSPAPAQAPTPDPTADGPAPTMMVRLPAPGALPPPPSAATPPALASPPSPPPTPAAAPPRPVELPAPALSASLLDAPEDVDAPRTPLPVAAGEQPPAALVQEPEDPRPRVKGFLCSRGHLNDPRVLFCNLCGIRMAEKTGVFLDGIRPPLGLLVFDNGATVTLDMDYVLGREPESEPRVQAGELRPLLIVDQTGGVSRHHAEIRLEGWDVVLVDTGSANGTLVAAQGAPAWSSLVPGQPVRLGPGTAVRMGSRQFVFESPHGGHL